MITLLRLSPYTGDNVSPSPNYDARKAPAIEGIVLHATADEGDEALALSWLRSPKSGVSCHMMVSRAGQVTRLVGDRQRAWHAGRSWWRGTSDVNSITLGIEIANRNDGEPYSDVQYERVATIVAHYCCQGLSLDDVVSHALIAEGRKSDPVGWDWDRFRAMVMDQLWPAEVPPFLTDPMSASAVSTSQTTAAPPTVRRTAPTQRAVVNPKHVLQSRTVWLNALTVIVALAMLVGDALDLAPRVGIQPPEDVIKWALFFIGIVNIILRLRTTRPLACGQNADPAPSRVPGGQQAMMKGQRRAREEAARAIQPDRGAVPVRG